MKRWGAGRRKIGSPRFGTRLEWREMWLSLALCSPLLLVCSKAQPPLWILVVGAILWLICFGWWIVTAVLSHHEVPKGWS